MRFEDMPKICIKCKKSEESGVEILKYDYYKHKGYGVSMTNTRIRTVGISFPVCKSCGLEFKQSEKLEPLYKRMKRALITFSIISWISILGSITYLFYVVYMMYRYSSIDQSFAVKVAILLIFITTSLGILFPILYNYARVKLKRLPNKNKINQYIELSVNGQVTIKDEEIKNEMIKKFEKDIYEYEQNINVIFCPKCGIKYNKGIDFCRQCGKDLRLIQKKL